MHSSADSLHLTNPTNQFQQKGYKDTVQICNHNNQQSVKRTIKVQQQKRVFILNMNMKHEISVLATQISRVRLSIFGENAIKFILRYIKANINELFT